eukprot:TRINITY_DN2739_c0_g1_i7.p1 TRINITY_DN2739_c0_g1~~TRINITY_DN2739_c0_g1_i7.p1  ORF type:complete len:114 (+),score=23.23 TRINITY_DN2739_c0_g1_i7:140-481(+)
MECRALIRDYFAEAVTAQPNLIMKVQDEAVEQIVKGLGSDEKSKNLVKDQIESNQPFLKAIIEAQMKSIHNRSSSIADEVFKALDKEKTGNVEKTTFVTRFQPLMNTGFQILD